MRFRFVDGAELVTIPLVVFILFFRRVEDRGRATALQNLGDQLSPSSNRDATSPAGLNAAPESSEARGIPSETNPGYLGFTSFSSVYRETQNSLSLVQGPSTGTPSGSPLITGPGNIDSPDANKKTVVLSPQALENCIAVLRRIPPNDTALPLFRKHVTVNSGWVPLATERIIESFLSVFARQLRSRKSKDLEDLAQVFSENTARPWCEEEPDPNVWLSSFTGRNMRWESLGILFTSWSLASNVNGGFQPDLRKPETLKSKSMTRVYQSAAEGCIELCRQTAPAPNSLLHHLAYTVAIIESMLSGDAAPAFWRLHGQQLAMVTYIGMHAAQHDASYVPTVASEARRRLASQSFVVDKVAACFNGRPPLLSRKYMLTPLPLDLRDEVLLSDTETISRAVAALDEKGWNTDGKVYPTTSLRARRMLASVTDEVMEVSLGDPSSTSIEALLALRQREIDAFAGLPKALMYSPEDIRDPRVEGSILYTKILIRLEHLQNIFCIGRLLFQWGYDNHAELLQVGSKMVTATLMLWTHRDRLIGLHGDFEWLVMAFAAPAGGILCNELLRPSQQHSSPVEGVTRSSIIQQLSLLNSFLQWVSPHAKNGDLCTSCKTIIQRVLDHALNPPPQGSSNAAADNAFDFNLDLSSDINAINGYFNFDLLDTYEWLRPEMLSNQKAG